jgi:hypothetical protein
MNIVKNRWAGAEANGRGAEDVDRWITGLALAVVFATAVCTAIIVLGPPLVRDAAPAPVSYNAQR